MKYISLILALLLLLCLLQMPYGYYMFIRFLSTVVFGIYAYRYYEAKKEGLAVTFTVLALLFQPFIKVALGRGLWNAVDIIVAVGLLVLYVVEKQK